MFSILAAALHSSARAQEAPAEPAADELGNVPRLDPDQHRTLTIPNLSDTLPGLPQASGSLSGWLPGGLSDQPAFIPGRPGQTRLRLLGDRPTAQEPRSVTARRSLYSRFGGFEDRTQPSQQSSGSSMLLRRRDLIQANRLNSPVQRAILRRSPLGGVTIPNPNPTSPEPAADAPPAPSLERLLRERTQTLHARASQSAWTDFAQEHYHSAARSFDSALELDPDDMESRIGELLSQVSVGAWHTAAAIAGEMNRRDLNPFLLNVELSDRYVSPPRAAEVRVRAKVLAQLEGTGEELIAVHVLTLWFLGERSDALRGAALLKRKYPAGGFARWVEFMQAAAETVRQPS